MHISLDDVSLWFDVSGPSVIPQGDTTVERPVLVAVHGGPGLDHLTVKSALGPLAEDFQVVCTSTCGATAAAITAAPSSGTCGPGLMTCGGQRDDVLTRPGPHDAIRRHAVDMDVQHREENRDLPARLAAQPEFRRRCGGADCHDAAIRGRHEQPGPARRRSVRDTVGPNRLQAMSSARASCPSSRPSICFTKIIIPDIIVLNGRNYGIRKFPIPKLPWRIIHWQ